MSRRSRQLFRAAVGAVALSLLASPLYAQKAKKAGKAAEKAGRPAETTPLPVPPAALGPKSLSETLTGDAKAAYEGGKLLYGDGDFAGAKVKFQAAYDSAQDPRLLWNMAVCEKGLRHYARVVLLTKKYLELGGALIAEDDRTEAKDLLNAIESFTVELTLDVNPVGAEIYVDGERVGVAPLDKALTVDIGTREISVRMAGFKPFQNAIPVGGQKQASLKVALTPELHQGELKVTAPKGGRILIDGKQVGVGHFTGKLKSGGHTLRVEAQGMRPYQSEVVVQDEEKRSVDVVLDAITAAAPPAEHHGPLYDMELGFRTGYGVMKTKAQAINETQDQTRSVSFIPLWFDIGYRLGRPTYLGLYTQFGWLDKSDTCGIVRHGSEPTGVDDASTRFGYHSCFMIKTGIDLVFHVMPRTIIDPYFGFDLGAQITVTRYNSYNPIPPTETRSGNDTNGSFQPGFQLGIDVHPHKDLGVGLFGHAALHIGNEGTPKDDGENMNSCSSGSGTSSSSTCCNGNCDGGAKVGSHVLIGTRVAYTFP